MASRRQFQNIERLGFAHARRHRILFRDAAGLVVLRVGNEDGRGHPPGR